MAAMFVLLLGIIPLQKLLPGNLQVEVLKLMNPVHFKGVTRRMKKKFSPAEYLEAERSMIGSPAVFMVLKPKG